MAEVTYNRLQQDEMETFDLEVERGDALRFDAPIPISRPPTSPRDLTYSSAYFFTFLGSSLVGFIHHSGFLRDSFVLYQRAGAWTDMLMVATLFGTVIGFFLIFALYYPSLREVLLKHAVPFSIGAQVTVAIAAYIGLGPQCWPLSLLVLAGACCDIVRYRESVELASFTDATLELAFQILAEYDMTLLAVFCALAVVQTGLLLWWGVIFVGLLTEVHAAAALLSMLVLGFAAYWTVQTFHAVVSTISGSCVLWYFLKGEDVSLDSERRVALYTQTALSSSLGSLCKGALLVPVSQLFLAARHWSSSASQPPRSHAEGALRQMVRALTESLSHKLHHNNRLVYPIIGIYGQTFTRASQDTDASEGISIVLDGTTNFLIKSVSTGATLIVLLVFAMSGRGDPSLPLFLFVSFYLILAGASLLVTAARAAVDTFSIAYTANPTLFARLSPVVFHRFVRAREAQK